MRKRKTLGHDEEEEMKRVEEENRVWASTFVVADKWEEANTDIWFPVGPKKRLWDVLILNVLLYSICVEPFRRCAQYAICALGA